LPDGSLWDECLISEDCDEEFLGRTADKLRFRPGDLAEVLYGDTVRLEIVGATPFSPEEVSEYKSKSIAKFFSLDFTDDVYYTMPISDNDDDHSHPEALNLFPLRLSVSDKLKSKLEARYRAYCLGMEKYKKEKS